MNGFLAKRNDNLLCQQHKIKSFIIYFVYPHGVIVISSPRNMPHFIV